MGLERDRLAMLLAVLHRHANVAAPTRTCSSTRWGRAHQRAGGDLAVLLAIAGSCAASPAQGFIAFGEVGLAGDCDQPRAGRNA